MSETNLWDWLKPYLPKGKYDRVESGDTAPGIPDVHYRLTDHEGWFELKESRNPTATTPFTDRHGVRKSQKIWISEYVALGGTCHIVAQVGGEILFIPGKFAYSVNGATLRRLKFFSVLVLSRDDPGAGLRKLKSLMVGELRK